MTHMFDFGLKTIHGQCQRMSADFVGFQNNSFLSKVAYNQVHKWPQISFWSLCCLHPFLAKKLSNVLRAQKTKKSYLKNGTFWKKKLLIAFVFFIHSGIEKYFQAKTEYNYLVKK